MSRSYKLAAVTGLAVLVLAVLLAGQALAQGSTPVPSSTPMPGSMMGATAMPGGMMGATPMPGNMMGGTPMSGSNIGGTPVPGGMMGGTPMPGNMLGGMPMPGSMPGGMMGPSAGITGTLSSWMQLMMAHSMMQMMANGMMGMMGNGMMGMMGNGMMGMMGMPAGWSDPNARPLTLDQAQAAAQKYLQSLPNNAGANLVPLKVIEFASGFYVAVGDKTTGAGALELLVDRFNGNIVAPECGPGMMWNTIYGMAAGQPGGMMGMMGMMGLWTPQAGAAATTVSEQQARANAQQFLDVKFPGAKLSADSTTFPGYYTLAFDVNGQPAGLLSVNAYTGQVWYHVWNGQFLSQRVLRAGA